MSRDSDAPVHGKVQPVTPDEASDLKNESIPDVVVETVNRLIARNMHLGQSKFLQKDLVAELVEAGLDPAAIQHHGWLDFEDLYRSRGWEVEYDKPGWNETYPASFKFTVPNGKRSG